MRFTKPTLMILLYFLLFLSKKALRWAWCWGDGLEMKNYTRAAEFKKRHLSQMVKTILFYWRKDVVKCSFASCAFLLFDTLLA